MYRRIACLTLAVLYFLPGVARAAEPAPTPAAMSKSETRFVRDVTGTLAKRFPTRSAAEQAGYTRYTNEDDTGAISYANNNWETTAEAKPSQLWYDVNGRLLGADYSVLVARHPAAPSLFGIAPARFTEQNAHVHYVVKNPDGSLTYSRVMGVKKFLAAGLDPMHPTAADLVRLGAVKSDAEVTTVFLFPHIWDVTVWVVPNPDGAFADKNPNVKPAHPPAATDMH